MAVNRFATVGGDEVLPNRPSWIVISPAPAAALRGAAKRNVRYVRGNHGVIAAYEPEPGRQLSVERALAAALSADHPGRHYAITLANVANDPDYGVDSVVAYENGAELGKPKADPVSLLAYFGLSVPGLERARDTLDATRDLRVTPPAPKPSADECKYLGFTISQWKRTFDTESRADISYLVDGARRSSYEAVVGLLVSNEIDVRYVAVCLLYFAPPEPAWIRDLESLRSKEQDTRVREAIDVTFGRWRNQR